MPEKEVIRKQLQHRKAPESSIGGRAGEVQEDGLAIPSVKGFSVVCAYRGVFHRRAEVLAYLEGQVNASSFGVIQLEKPCRQTRARGREGRGVCNLLMRFHAAFAENVEVVRCEPGGQEERLSRRLCALSCGCVRCLVCHAYVYPWVSRLLRCQMRRVRGRRSRQVMTCVS